MFVPLGLSFLLRSSFVTCQTSMSNAFSVCLVPAATHIHIILSGILSFDAVSNRI